MTAFGRNVFAWTCFIVCVALTVVPPTVRPVTGLPHDVEHLLMFLLIGLAFMAAYRGREYVLYAAAIVFCAVLELMQMYIPGRHARLSDFIVDAAAAVAGVGIAQYAGSKSRARSSDVLARCDIVSPPGGVARLH